ncbi:Hemagglutinin-related protein [Granulibacter bethesdensis]|uniref:Hemagglutinin-related protein n=2 Tax=Granulibacter bethesdensis TaxID=364410 RepID=A0AAC9P7D2_9PROT|nr:Hemagglutinin-related protein [Granulibacter bethesdensis]
MTTLTSTVSGVILNTADYSNPIIIDTRVRVANTNGIGIQSSLTNYSWAISNRGVIEGSSEGISLAGSSSLTNMSGGLISGYDAGLDISIGATIDNTGTIQSIGPQGTAVRMLGGGAIINHSGGMISGTYKGISFNAPTGTIINDGLITDQGGTTGGAPEQDSAFGIYMGDANTPGFNYLQNTGTILETGNIVDNNAQRAAVNIVSGGSILNSGFIGGNGSAFGIRIYYGGTITNFGTVSAAGTADASNGMNGAAIYMAGAGTNLLQMGVHSQIIGTAAANSLGRNTLELLSGSSTGTLNIDQFIGFQRGSIDSGAIWTMQGTGLFSQLVNAGTLSADSGITLNTNAATLTNAADAVILADNSSAVVSASGTNAFILNAGSIGNSGEGAGIALSGSGTVSNAAGGIISAGMNAYAVSAASGDRVTINNAGTLINTAGGDAAGGISAGSGAVILNSGLISSAEDGIDGTGLTVVNSGTILSTNSNMGGLYLLGGGNVITNTAGGLIKGNFPGIGIYGGGTVNNAGTVIADGSNGVGVQLGANNYTGVLVNSGTVIASGDSGIGVFFGVGGAITNLGGGTISGNGCGVEVTNLYASGSIFSGTVINHGLIIDHGGTSAAAYGVYLNADTADYLSNSGTILETGTDAGAGSLAAVRLGKGGVVVNSGSIGVVNTSAVGVRLDQSGTVTNFGTVSATGTAIALNGTAENLLQVGVNASMSGLAVANSAGTNTLELLSGSSTGTLNIDQFIGFQRGSIDSGAIWTMQGTGLFSQLVNAGTLSADSGITLNTNAATLTNAADAVILADNSSAVVSASGTNAFILNAGSIGNSGEGAGIVLSGSGTVSNAAGGIISAGMNAYAVSAASGDRVTINNAGTLINTAGGDAAGGISAGSGAVILNSGLISSAEDGIDGTGLTVVNSGTILSTNSNMGGLYLLGGGNIITNTAGGLIKGNFPGIGIYGGGTVNNAGTVIADGPNGVGVQLGANNYTGVLVNSGTVIASGDSGIGVFFGVGGAITNLGGGTISGNGCGVEVTNLYASGSIFSGTVINHGLIIDHGGTSAAAYGVYLNADTADYLSNSGTILETGTDVGAGSVAAVRLGKGGVVVNSGSIGVVNTSAVGVRLDQSGTVTNSGTVSATGTAIALNGTAANLLQVGVNASMSGLAVANSAGTNTLELLSGSSTGTLNIDQFIGFQRGSIDSGAIWTMQGTGLFSQLVNAGTLSADSGITLNTNAATLTNAADAVILADNSSAVVSASGTNAFILNAGSIGNSGEGAGIVLSGSGTVSNAAGGIISAGMNAYAVSAASGDRVTINNAGTLINTAGGDAAGGISAGSGAVILNSGLISSAEDGIDGTGLTVVNSGTILSTNSNMGGLYLLGGGNVITNTAGGLIKGNFPGIGIYGGGTVNNAGTVIADGPNGVGVQLGANNYTGVLVNSGTVIASGDSGIGVFFGVGGAITNLGGGTISGNGCGVEVTNLYASGSIFSGTVINHGLIIDHGGTSAATYGVYLNADTADYLSNSGTILETGTDVGAGSLAAVRLGKGGVVVNSGSIGVVNTSAVGVRLDQSGTVTNSGIISAAGSLGVGINLAAGGTVINTGTIDAGGSNAKAIVFSAGNSRLAISGSSSITGQVSAAGTGNVLELDGAGTTLSGFGTQYTGFQTINVKGNGWVLADTLTNTNILMQTTGTLTISQTLDASNTITMGGTSSAGTASGNIIISTPGTALAATVANFGNGQSITLTGLAYQASDVANVVDNGGNVFLILSHVASDGTKTQYYSIKLDPNAYDQNYKIRQASGSNRATIYQSSGANGVTIYDDGTPCYVHGTLILTDRGEVPVEYLKIGDNVITASGAVRPIRWLGRRSYNGRFIQGRQDVLPVRIRQGALDGVLPKRDLLVSPLHAMFIEGVLVPAGRLVNGVSIIQEQHVETLSYVHIELDTHDVVLAEGAASETYVEDNNRNMFHNAHTYAGEVASQIRKPFRKRNGVVTARYCARRVIDGMMLESIRQKIMAQVNRQNTVSLSA